MKLTNLKLSAKVDRIPAKNDQTQNNREHHADVICEVAELEVPVEEIVKTTEILGKEFFLGLVKLAMEESKISRIQADARMQEANNEKERLELERKKLAKENR